MAKSKTSQRWHPSQESDELIFAVCDRFISQTGRAFADSQDEDQRRGAAAIAEWLQTDYGRTDLTREKIYPLFWEAAKRHFLLLQPPIEAVLAESVRAQYHLENYPGQLTVVNVRGNSASQHVTSVAADQIIHLIDQVYKDKKEKAVQNGQNPEDVSVHLGMGAGYAAMLVARRMAHRFNSGQECPSLVLHAISAGGFLVDEPHKAPTTYFSYFDETLPNIKYVALFSETVVQEGEYEKVRENPSVRISFQRKAEIDIIVTSLAVANHQHGLLKQYLKYLVSEKLLKDDVLKRMFDSGWVGDVQFRPYSKNGPLTNCCPVRAVTLFELDELREFAASPGKYVVLVGGPCGECGTLKTEAVRPLLENEKLRLWTHLITDSQTARELIK